MPTGVLDFVHDTTLSDMPAEVVSFGQRCLLDLLGVAIVGRTTELSRLIHQHAISHFGPGSGPDGAPLSAPLVFDNQTVSPTGSALALGMTIDSIDAHDGNKLTKGHTGCHQLPALLAFTSAVGADDPAEFLAALIVGYEFATRAGIGLHATAPDYHTSGAWGAVGAAALGARVLGLDHDKTFHAMGIAEYHGPRSQMMRVIDHPTMLKDGSGWGAMAGVSAAFLAADGFTGAPAVTVNDPALDELWGDLGERWIILEQYFKPLPICRWAQPAVEATLQLRRLHDVDARDVAAIHVTTFHEAARLAVAHPVDTEQAQYSLPFPVAAAMARGEIGAAEITEDGLNDDEIARLADTVTLAESDRFNEAFPARRFAQVSITLQSGTVLESSDCEPAGDPENHLPMNAIRTKFHAFADPLVGRARATEIEGAVDELPEAGSMSRLRRAIDRPI